ncbi:MAG: hypothetical protein R3E32_20045 [Chitinophagales bacterium]
MSLFSSKFVHIPKNRTFDYSPRYYDAEEEERKEKFEQNIKLERGAFFKGKNRSRLVGAFSEKELVFRKKNDRSQQTKRTVLLISILSIFCLGMGGMIPAGWAGLIGAFLLLSFIVQVKKM